MLTSFKGFYAEIVCISIWRASNSLTYRKEIDTEKIDFPLFFDL